VDGKRTRYRVERYNRRFWCVLDGMILVCVTVYKKGAVEAAARLNALADAVARERRA